MDIEAIVEAGNLLQRTCSQESAAGGWHNDLKTGLPRTQEQNDDFFPTRIALAHSELSEALEGHRKRLMDAHLPNRQSVEVELADAIIRIFDMAGAMGYDIGQALAEKLQYNAKRQDHLIENRKKTGGKLY